MRAAVALATLVGALVLTACEPEIGTAHFAKGNDRGCEVETGHGADVDSGGHWYASITSPYNSFCLGGYAARLQFRWVDGDLYINEYDWATSGTTAFSINRSGIESPESHHIACRYTDSCKYFEN